MPSSTITLTKTVPTALGDQLGLPASPRTAGSVISIDREIGLALIRQGYAQQGNYTAPGSMPTSSAVQVVLTQNVPAALATTLGLSGAQTLAGATLTVPSNDANQLIRADVARFADVHGASSTGAKTSATATLDFPSIAAAGQAELTVPVSGAVVGDAVVVGAPAALNNGLIVNGRVTAAGVVTVRVSNITAAAIDPASASWRVAVVKF